MLKIRTYSVLAQTKSKTGIFFTFVFHFPQCHYMLDVLSAADGLTGPYLRRGPVPERALCLPSARTVTLNVLRPCSELSSTLCASGMSLMIQAAVALKTMAKDFGVAVLVRTVVLLESRAALITKQTQSWLCSCCGVTSHHFGVLSA